MAFYGRTYTLGSPDNHGLHAPVKKWDTNGGLPGRFTNESGFLSYFEFCQDEETWTKEFDKIGQCPYAYKQNQWVGYEDANSLRAKMDWLRKEKYGGAMIWALDLDDYRGVCGEKDALFNVITKGLECYSVRVPPANELTTTKKPNTWWSPPPSSTTTTSTTTTTTTTTASTSRPKTTRFTEPTTTRKPTPASTSASTTTQRPMTGGELQPSTGAPTECPVDSTGQMLSSFRPHQTDNTLYLWCINGKDLVLSCPPGTEWNNVDKQCMARETSAGPLPLVGHPLAADHLDHLDISLSAPQADRLVALFESSRIRSASQDSFGAQLSRNPEDDFVFLPQNKRRLVDNFHDEMAPIQNIIFPPGRPIEWF